MGQKFYRFTEQDEPQVSRQLTKPYFWAITRTGMMEKPAKIIQP
jgi:hypothetical protein